MDFQRIQKIHKAFDMHILQVKEGQLLELHEEIGEGDTKRIRKFKGMVIKTWKTSHPDGTFTIRGVTSGVTIEKVYPFAFPNFKKVILLDEYKVRRSKLYYIREKIGKDARMKSGITSERRGIDLLQFTKHIETSFAGNTKKNPEKMSPETQENETPSAE